MASWTKSWSDFKSPLRVVVQFLQRSRENKAKKCRELKEKLEATRRLLAQREAELEQQREKTRQAQEQARRFEAEKRIAERSARLLPVDPCVGKHGYGARMISLSLHLAQGVQVQVFHGRRVQQPVRLAAKHVEQAAPAVQAVRRDVAGQGHRLALEIHFRRGAPRAPVVARRALAGGSAGN